MSLIGQDIGRYHIVEQLGQGGMATVYKAYDTRLERDVAIKVIRIGAITPDMLPELLKRFEREAKSLAKMKHRDIVNIHDYGEYEGAPYLVMEYLPGGTLKEQTGRPIPYQNAAKLLLPIARALDYAHKRGVLHRDVKPANILITEDGDPLLSDFGIAKMLESGQETQLTGTGVGIGTPEYMAPEQWTGKVLLQTDVYALGIVLYELVTGRKPFTADTPAAILLKQVNDPLPRPKVFVPELPDEVEMVLFKALAKHPEDRYPVMGEFAKALSLISQMTGEGADDLGTLVRTPVTSDEVDPVAKHPRSAAEGAVQALVEMAQDYQAEGNLNGAADVYRRALEKCAAGTQQAQEIRAAIDKLDISLQKPPAATPARPETPTRDRQASPAAPPQRAPAAPRLPAKPWWGQWYTWAGATVVLFLILALSGAFSRPAEVYEEVAVEPAPAEEPAVEEPVPTETPEPIDGSKVGMVEVPAGEFEMGSTNGDSDEAPVHSVYLDTFRIDRTEVTNVMYAECVAAGACKEPL